MSADAEEKTYSGSCQCGAVTFSATTALDGLVQCNCSRCRRTNQVMQSVPADRFTLVSGGETLATYRFNSEKISHRFCPVCGIQPFAHGTDAKGNALYMVNVHCLDGAQYDREKVTHFNGADY